MDKATATAAINSDAAQVVTLVDGDTITGIVFSVNSKGINVRTDDGRVVSRALSRVASIDPVTPDTDDTDGATPADLADMFNMAAKDIRVVLRRLGMGVGKGQRYAIDAAGVARVRDAIEADRAAAAAADADADA